MAQIQGFFHRGIGVTTKNRESLLSHGNVAGRQAVLDIIEAGIAAADPYDGTRALLRLEEDRLTVGRADRSVPAGNGPQVFDLKTINSIYVVGGGKAVQRQAKAFEDVLGERITEGHINIKKGEQVQLKRIGVTLAGHPLPDQDGVRGASKIFDILGRAREGDIVFWLRSGGGTSLLALPVEGVTLEELAEVSRVLYFGAGASMPEINIVRNLISVLGLKHPKYVRGATLFEFLADEIPAGSKGHVVGLPAVAGDPYGRAKAVLNKYRVWDKIPRSVRDIIAQKDSKNLPPSPTELRMRPFYVYRVIDPHAMFEAALGEARALGLNAAVLALSFNDIDARATGEVLGDIAQESDLFGRPLTPPCVFLSGGETVVAVGRETGIGGRNQELVLAASTRITGSKNIVIGSVDSDGTDGPTNMAGGIVDGTTSARILEAGFDLGEELRHHNSTPVLQALGDTVVLGNTGTNLRDLRVVYVGAAAEK